MQIYLNEMASIIKTLNRKTREHIFFTIFLFPHENQLEAQKIVFPIILTIDTICCGISPRRTSRILVIFGQDFGSVQKTFYISCNRNCYLCYIKIRYLCYINFDLIISKTHVSKTIIQLYNESCQVSTIEPTTFQILCPKPNHE